MQIHKNLRFAQPSHTKDIQQKHTAFKLPHFHFEKLSKVYNFDLRFGKIIKNFFFCFQVSKTFFQNQFHMALSIYQYPHYSVGLVTH